MIVDRPFKTKSIFVGAEMSWSKSNYFCHYFQIVSHHLFSCFSLNESREETDFQHAYTYKTIWEPKANNM